MKISEICIQVLFEHLSLNVMHCNKSITVTMKQHTHNFTVYDDYNTFNHHTIETIIIMEKCLKKKKVQNIHALRSNSKSCF